MKLYSCNISSVSEKEFREWFGAMSEKKKEAVRKLLVPQKQKLKIAADHICRKAISEFCGIPAQDIEFSVSEFGKPYIKGLNVHFNISHSGDCAVCAVSDKEIGVDIEKIRSINPETSKRFACENEQDYIDSHTDGFFEIWTLKEAYFKCIGTGLGADIKTVSFEISESGISCSEKSFDCLFHQIADGYICSTCEQLIIKR
ncbi:MAG: 4'-phosphopantetheinyl transferase superfamily protein [Clostridia bacterium]|nr:4'-phosphopantetheinyl transferase superfamily protein [Clostridia bacterium]